MRPTNGLNDYLRRLDEGDVEEGGTGGGARTKNLAEKIAALRERRGRYRAMLADLERTGESQISLTDPDSRAMAAHTKVGVGYNVQIAIDAKHKLIVEQDVTNQVVDMGLLTQTAEPARDVLGVETIDVVADQGYFKSEDIEACENAGCDPYVPAPQRGPSVREACSPRTSSATTRWGTPTAVPRPSAAPNHDRELRGMKKVNYRTDAACPKCPMRPRCTSSRDG